MNIIDVKLFVPYGQSICEANTDALSLQNKGETPLVCFPSFDFVKIHPFVALLDDWVFRPLRRATRGYAPLDGRSLFRETTPLALRGKNGVLARDAKTFNRAERCHNQKRLPFGNLFVFTEPRLR